MRTVSVPADWRVLSRLILVLAVALLLAIILVPVQSSGYPGPESANETWAVSKLPAGASKPVISSYAPDCDGTWHARIQNEGLRSMVLEIYDQSDGGSKILHQNLIFSKLGAYPSGVVDSDPCEMSAGSVYKIVTKGFSGPRGSSATVTPEYTPHGALGLVLDERFTSWDTIDAGWSFWNLTVGGYRSWFDVSGGLMLATSNDVLAHGDFVSLANWTHYVSCQDSITISFDIYLPTDCDHKLGWAGQVFWFAVYDSQGVPLVVSRFVMDNPWDTDHVGWVFLAGSHMTMICGFNAGWHHVVYEIHRGSNAWTGIFDEAVFEGLPLSTVETAAYDVGMIQFRNSLREEVQVVLVDNLRIESA